MRCVGPALEATLLFDATAPGELTPGRPFVTLRTGDVVRRMGGETVVTVTREHLSDMARLIRERSESDPVVIDWQHGSSPDTPQAPDVAGALGRLTGARVDGDALIVVPAYNDRGVKAVTDAAGVLWSSPEFVLGDIHARDGSGRIGSAQILAITLTPRPAQQADRIDAITLAETGDDTEEHMADQAEQVAVAEEEGGESLDSLRAERDSLREALSAAEARIAELEGAELSEDVATTAAALTERTTEVAKLQAQVTKLTDAFTAQAALADQARRDADIDRLIRDGVPPVRKGALEQAWSSRESQPAVWAALSERTVPLGVDGSAAAGEVETDEVKRARLRKQMAESDSPAAFLSDLQKNDREGYQLVALTGAN